MTNEEAITVLSVLKNNEGILENEQNVDALITAISALESTNKIKAERDAAVNSLRCTFGNCQYCKHNDFLTHRCKSTPNPGKCWEWRGIQDDECRSY